MFCARAAPSISFAALGLLSNSRTISDAPDILGLSRFKVGLTDSAALRVHDRLVVSFKSATAGHFEHLVISHCLRWCLYTRLARRYDGVKTPRRPN